MSAAATPVRSTPKTGTKSRIVTLHLSADALSSFPSDSPSTKRRSAPFIKPDAQSPSVQPGDAADKSSDSNSTPVPSAADGVGDANSLAPSKGDGKKKRGGATSTGRKRAPPTIDPDAPPRERGRPGPKKKPRLPDGTIDRSQDKTITPGATVSGGGGAAAAATPATAAATTTASTAAAAGSGATVVAAHKLGPKANTGAINAGLRALDRSGKPCRKWEKKGLMLKSFTGTSWSMSTWKSPSRDPGFAGDVKSDSADSSEVNKPNESSAVPSERSNSGADPVDKSLMNGIVSSPAPPVAVA